MKLISVTHFLHSFFYFLFLFFYNKLRADGAHTPDTSEKKIWCDGEYSQHVAHLICDGGGDGVVDLEG